MRCVSYCTAFGYNISSLVQEFVDKGYEPKYFDDVIHIQKNFGKKNRVVDVFYFPFGCVNIWGSEESEDKIVLDELKDFEIDSVYNPTYDIIYYRYKNSETNHKEVTDITQDITAPIEHSYVKHSEGKAYIDEEKNEVILLDNNTFVKLSIAHALAQSVKLEILEISVANLIERTMPLRKELAKKGSVSLSKREISKQIGVLFNERYSINMNSDILDTPEFFWRRPSYEPLYLTTAEFQDIQIRQNILNRRLDMIHELYSILSNELNYIHSTRLEWIVIILIGIEVMIGLQNHNFLSFLMSFFK